SVLLLGLGLGSAQDVVNGGTGYPGEDVDPVRSAWTAATSLRSSHGSDDPAGLSSGTHFSPRSSALREADWTVNSFTPIRICVPLRSVTTIVVAMVSLIGPAPWSRSGLCPGCRQSSYVRCLSGRGPGAWTVRRQWRR